MNKILLALLAAAIAVPAAAIDIKTYDNQCSQFLDEPQRSQYKNMITGYPFWQRPGPIYPE